MIKNAYPTESPAQCDVEIYSTQAIWLLCLLWPGPHGDHYVVLQAPLRWRVSRKGRYGRSCG